MKPVRSGDPLSQSLTADNWNRILRKLYEATATRQPPTFSKPNHDLVMVQGDFSKNIYEAVTLTQPAFDNETGMENDLDSIYYNFPQMGCEDTVTDPVWVVLQDYLEDQQPARAVITGLTWAYVDVADLNHEYVAPTPSNDGLETKLASTSARIVHNPATSTGMNYVLIYKSLKPESHSEIVVPNATIAGRTDLTLNSGTAEIYAGTPLAGIGTNIDLYNLSQTDIPSGCPVIATRVLAADIWVAEPRVTDLRVNGLELELRRNCDWLSWHTGQDCET